MKLDIYFVVLVSGYIFTQLCSLTRYASAREEGYRIVLTSGVAAVLLIAVSYLMVSNVNCPWSVEMWNRLAPKDLQNEFGRSAGLAFLLSWTSVIPINLAFGNRAARKRIEREGTLLDNLLFKAMGGKWGAPVEIKMKGGAFFTGAVLAFDEPGNDQEKHVQLRVLWQGTMNDRGEVINAKKHQIPVNVMIPVQGAQWVRQLNKNSQVPPAISKGGFWKFWHTLTP